MINNVADTGATMTTEELAEADAYYAQLEQETMEHMECMVSPEGLAINSMGWALLNLIHEETAPTMANIVAKELLIDNL
jgi:hypothetical protein